MCASSQAFYGCHCGALIVRSALCDCFNGEIVVIEIRDNMKNEFCIDTVERLRERFGKTINGAVFHRDRGCQYTSYDFRAKNSTFFNNTDIREQINSRHL